MSSRGNSWANLPGQISVEIYTHEMVVYDAHTDKPIPCLNATMFCAGCDGGEIIIDFLSTGFYEPASMYGGSDHLGWPANGDDERTLEDARIQGDTDELVLSQVIKEELFSMYEDRINEEEIDSDSD